MASEDAKAALYRTIRATLTASQSEIWGQNAYLGQVPANSPSIERPVAIYANMTFAEANQVKAHDASGIFMVKCIADSIEEALAGAARISELLNDRGVQDTLTSPLDAGSVWDILTITQGLSISYIENISNTQQVYHEGWQFMCQMGVV